MRTHPIWFNPTAVSGFTTTPIKLPFFKSFKVWTFSGGLRPAGSLLFSLVFLGFDFALSLILSTTKDGAS